MEHSTWDRTSRISERPPLGKCKGLGGKVKPGLGCFGSTCEPEEDCSSFGFLGWVMSHGQCPDHLNRFFFFKSQLGSKTRERTTGNHCRLKCKLDQEPITKSMWKTETMGTRPPNLSHLTPRGPDRSTWPVAGFQNATSAIIHSCLH